MQKILLLIIALLSLIACKDAVRQQADEAQQAEVSAAVPLDSLPEGTCRRCRGTGRILCFWCQGKGKFSCGACSGKCYNNYSMGRLHRKTCDLCQGSGKLHCNICDGSGNVMCDSCVGTGKE